MCAHEMGFCLSGRVEDEIICPHRYDPDSYSCGFCSDDDSCSTRVLKYVLICVGCGTVRYANLAEVIRLKNENKIKFLVNRKEISYYEKK